MPKQRLSFFYRNGLSLVLLTFMLIFWACQYVAGWKDHNATLIELHEAPLAFFSYSTSGHFISATFENWESEFLQMAMYVVLTVFLRQRGSAESKKLKDEEGAGEEEVDREPVAKPGAPASVIKGGWRLAIYKYSLSLTFGLLFLLSFILHFFGSLAEHNEEELAKGKPASTVTEYLSDPHFWFESFQNWQSEFLAVAAIVLLSIWLRQKGSPESKPVDAPHNETGKD